MARFESPTGGNRRARTSGPGPYFKSWAFALLLGAMVGLCVGEGAAQQPGPKPAASSNGPGAIPLGTPGALFAPNPANNATVPIFATPGTAFQPDGVTKTGEGLKLQPPGPYAGPLSNPLLSPGPNGLPRASQPSAATQEKIAKYVAKLLDPETTLDLVTNQTRVMMLKGAPIRIQSGDDAVLGRGRGRGGARPRRGGGDAGASGALCGDTAASHR